MININFIETFVTWQNDKIEVDLAILVDDIKIKDTFGMNFECT